MNLKRLMFVASSILLVSCMARGPAYVPISHVADNLGMIVIYRPAKFEGNGILPGVHINGIQAFELGNGGFGIVELEPGSYRVSTPEDDKWTTEDAPATISIEIEEGELLFLRWQPKIEAMNMVDATFIGEFVIVDRSQAEIALKKLAQVYP